MNQIIHILSKDLKRFVLDIALSLTLLVLYTWSVAEAWYPPSLSESWDLMRYQIPLLVALVLLLSWMVMLIRVVQEEPPVGDRQFWVTRPYEWPKLLGAKVLFVVLAIHVPLFIAQMTLLALAGFAPFHYLAGLLYMHLLLAVLLLGVASLAAITAGLRQTLLTIFLALVCIAASLALDDVVPSASAWRGYSLWNSAQFGLLLGIPAVVFVRQYAVRKTTQARQLLLTAALALLVLTAATPYRQLIEREYPVPSPREAPVFRLQIDQPTAQAAQVRDNELYIDLNLSAGGVARGYIATIDAIMVAVEAPDGTRWDSGWLPNQTIMAWDQDSADPGPTIWHGLEFPLHLDKKLFGRIKALPVRVRVAVATTVFRDDKIVTIANTQGQFDVPGLGICVAGPNYFSSAPWCRAPLRLPRMLGVTGRLHSNCLPQNDGERDDTSWFPNSWSTPAEVGFSPVSESRVHVSVSTGSGQSLGFCPGDPVTYRFPALVGRVRVEQEFPDIFLGGVPPHAK